jgi:ribosomal protein S27AE
MQAASRIRPNPCDNMNHRRRDAPVSHCPECGGVVNAALAGTSCSEPKHAAARRRQSRFCVDCGTQLVIAR